MENKKSKIRFYQSLSENLPNNNRIYIIIIIIKCIPLFVITHDWNISSEKGVSYWIRKAILSEFISKSIPFNIFPFLIILIFLLFLSSIFFKIFGNHYTFKSFLFKNFSYIYFYLFYAFNQFIYSIFIEVIFNKKNKKYDDWFNYFLLGLIIILIIGFYYININLCTIVIHSPLFINNPTFIVNPLNEISYEIVILSFIQGIIQLEFHLKFSKMMIVKNIFRGLFVLYYLKSIFTYNVYYCSFFIEYIKRIFLTSCFISCLIEWGFYYDFDNQLLILQKDIGIIILKLIIEINLSIVLTDIYFHFEHNILINKISNLSSKNIKSIDYNLIKFFNMLYYKDRQKIVRKILMRLNIVIDKSVHHPKCKDLNCYYCYEYSFYEFNFQMDNFFTKKTIKKSNFSLQIEFPLLYKYLYNEISAFYDNFSYGKKNQIIPKIFIVISFFLLFEKNYMKCLYIIEKINSSEQEKKKYFIYITKWNVN